jgi:hypothetical protein
MLNHKFYFNGLLNFLHNLGLFELKFIALIFFPFQMFQKRTRGCIKTGQYLSRREKITP